MGWQPIRDFKVLFAVTERYIVRYFRRAINAPAHIPIILG